MALDFKRKRKTEIDDITGEIIKIAKKNDIPYESINYFYRKLTSQRFQNIYSKPQFKIDKCK